MKNVSHWLRSIEIYTVSMLVNDVNAYHALRNSRLMVTPLTGRFSTTTRPTPKAKFTKQYYRWRTMNTHNQEPIDTTKFSFPYLVIDIIVNNRRRIQQFPTFHNNFSSIDRMAHMEPAKWSTALPSISLRFFRQPKKGIE